MHASAYLRPVYGRLLLLAGCLFCLLHAPLACPQGQAGENLRIRLLMPWSPQAQFAGYYLALKEGEYAKRGLDVEILHAQPQDQLSALMYNCVADFVVCPPDSAIGIFRLGTPVRLVSQIIQRSNLALVAWKDSGIASPHDFNRRRVSLWLDIYRPSMNAFFNNFQIKPTVLPQGYSQALFLNRAVDACAAMAYNEVHALQMQGVQPEEVRVFSLFDYGIDLVEDGLYVSEAFAKTHPEACAAMAEATLAGWRRAEENFADAIAIVMQWVNESYVPTSRVHQEYMLKTILPTIWPRGRQNWRPGRLDRDDYESVCAAIANLDHEDYFPPIPHLSGESDSPENDGSDWEQETDGTDSAESPPKNMALPSYEEFTWETAR